MSTVFNSTKLFHYPCSYCIEAHCCTEIIVSSQHKAKMGCGPSKTPQERPVRLRNIGQPEEAALLVPRLCTDAESKRIRIQDYELDESTLSAALSLMADHLVSKGLSLTVLAVGGAVNVMLLKSRRTTHDVDFFGTNINNEERAHLSDAAKYAETHSNTPLGGEWFNNHAQLWLNRDVHCLVTRQALEQNEAIFERRGLRILAAPWNFALCGKIDRLLKPAEVRPYDKSDAVAYLHHYVQRNQGHPVLLEDIRTWCSQYRKQYTRGAALSINERHRLIHGEDGIRL